MTICSPLLDISAVCRLLALVIDHSDRLDDDSRITRPRKASVPMPAKTGRQTVQGLLPSLEPVRFVGPDGTAVKPPGGYRHPADEALLAAYRAMVVGRRFDTQATALTKQGRLA